MPEPGELEATLAARIAEHGPISMTAYMAAANGAYYAAADPLGTAGDFITAPEVSQMFGELVGLWCTDLRVRAGESHVHYVELGPGRGTLAADALRASANYGWKPDVHFVETSPVLRTIQSEKFPDAVHHDSVGSLPGDAPLIVVANEFFDALPVCQYERTAEGWRERLIGHEKGRGFVVLNGEEDAGPFVPLALREAPEGTIFEASHVRAATMLMLGRRIARQGGALLVIDYGHAAPGHGETLQAVRRHAPVDPISDSGLNDLSAHVDFAALIAAGEAAGLKASPVTTQGAFLGALGIGPRAEALVAANPDDGDAVRVAMKRLTDPAQMGELFKVLAFTAPGWPDPSGF